MVRLAWVAAALFIATVWAANYAVKHYGFVPVGDGLTAPAGVYFAGLAFVLRDFTQRQLGVPIAVAAIVAGTVLSVLVSARLAVASGCAFAASEFAALAVFWLLRRATVTAVTSAQVVAAAIDSYVFLAIAFGSLVYWPGQFVGKMWLGLAALPVVVLSRRLAPA